MSNNQNLDFANSTSHITKFKGSGGVRNIIRNLALNTLGDFYGFSGRTNSSFKINRIHFILFHYLFKDEVSNFRSIIETLSKDHEFLSHSTAVEKIISGIEINRPYISFSSDDGLKSNLRAAEILDEFNIKGCFFVCPSMIGEKDPKKIKSFNRDRINCPPMEYMNWNDLESLLSRGHEIGNHTMNHIDFSNISSNEAIEDVNKSKEILTSRLGAIDHFAYPYGTSRHFSNEAKEIVFNAGHKSISSAIRGCHVTNAAEKKYNEICIRRENVVFSWPKKHILYFLAKGAHDANPKNDYFPFDKI